MTDDGVPSDEMRWFSSQTDPIDAVLSGDARDEDLLDVAAIVHDLRSAYLPEEPLSHRPALAAFTGAHLEADRDWGSSVRDGVPAAAASVAAQTHRVGVGRKRNKMLSAISGLVATLTGKVVLGTAVAAASVGGLHAADVVTVPALPNNDSPGAEQQFDGEPGSPSSASAEGQQTAAEKQAAARAYAEAVQEWTDCVADNAAAQGTAETRTTGQFDPREGCGDHPRPQDFGLTDLPSQAADAADSTGVGGSPGAAFVPTERGDEVPAGGMNDPTNGGASPPVPEHPGSTPPTSGGANSAVPEDLGSHQPTDAGDDIPAGGLDDPTSGGPTTPAGGVP
jgi:hypothetical protein